MKDENDTSKRNANSDWAKAAYTDVLIFYFYESKDIKHQNKYFQKNMIYQN